MRESTSNQPTSAAGPCPTDEELAAYIDGGLSPAESRRVTEHLASCADCFELYSETARFLVEPNPATNGDSEHAEVLQFLPHTGWRRQGMQWLSLAAAALLVGAVTAYLQLLAPPQALVVNDVTASLQGKPDLAQGFWLGSTKRGIGDDDQEIPSTDASFRIGVQIVNLELSLRANDAKGASGDILPRIFGVLKTQYAATSLKESYTKLSRSLESKVPRELVEKAAEIAHEAREDFDESYFDLGLWVEAGRLASFAKDPSFFQQGNNRKFLRHLIWNDKLKKSDDKLDPATLAILKQISDVLPSGDLQPSDYAKLRPLFDKILEIHYPYT
jgi:hypothetical protein